jgi:hypothetical protein
MLACERGLFAGIPLAFSLGFDAHTINQEVQQTSTATMRQVHVQRLLTAARRAKIRHCPVQSDQPQQALDKPSCLPQRHTKQDLQRQTSLNGGVTEFLLPTALAARQWHPNHLWIKPN